MKKSKLFQRMFFLLLMGFSLSVVCVACGDDDDEPFTEESGGGGGTGNGGDVPVVNDDPSLNTTDVAVTGFVTSLGHNYATINGYVNLNLLVGSGTPEFGVELCLSGSGASVRQETTGELVGRAFTVTIRSLSASTVYQYRSFVKYGGVTYYGEYKTFTTEEFKLDASVAVDLGLSVKWAAYNVGATSPEEYGNYYAWGETRTKSSYDYDNSTTYGLSTSTLESRGIIGSDGNLTSSYDAATVNWGGSWRMPTLDEMKELLNNCTWTWTTQNGVKGREVTGPNGNSIFLPAAGGRYGTSLLSAGSDGNYWSATPYSDSDDAYYLYFGSDYYDWSYLSRSLGRAVRPVSE